MLVLRARSALFAAMLLVCLDALRPAHAAAGPGISPLPPLAGDDLAGAVPAPAPPAAPSISPLLPFAQEAAVPPPVAAPPPVPASSAGPDPADLPAVPLPFATPPAGLRDEDDADPNAPKSNSKTQKPIECDTDAQCPAQAVCARHVCKSVQRMTSGIVYFHQPGPIGFRLVVPFYFSFWRPERTTQALLPLFVDRREKDAQGQQTQRDLWVFPTYQHRRTPTENTHRLWPLFFYSNYGSEGRALGLLPLFFWQHRGSVSSTLIPPLLFFERIDTEKQARDTVFLPGLVYWRKRPERELALFLGLGYYSRREQSVSAGFFPLVWYSGNAVEHKTVVLPLFFEGGNQETGTRYATLPPLFLYRRWEDKSHLILTPFGGSYHDGPDNDTTTLWLAPPAYHRDTPASSLTVVPPLAALYRNKQSGRSAGYVGPVIFSRDDAGRSDVVLPLYFRFENYAARSQTHILPPLLTAVHRSPALSFGFVGPAYGWSRPATPARPAGFGGGLLPLFSFASGPQSHVALLPPVFLYTADRVKGRYHFNLGPIFYRSVTKGPDAGYNAGVFPLLFVSRHGKDATQLLFPLFYHHTQPGQETLVFGPLFWRRVCPQFWGDPKAAVSGGIVPLLFWKRSTQSSYTALLPLFVEHRTPTTQTVVAGPFFYHRERPATALGSLLPAAATTSGGATTVGLLPLFVAHRSPTQTLVIGPAFGYSRTAERKTLVIGPYVETVAAPGQPEQAISRMLLPFYFFHCSPGRRAQVLFPLYMNIQDETIRFRSIAMLYYGIRGKETAVDALFPLFLSVRTPQRRTTLVGPFFHHKNTQTETMAVGLFPLFGYGQTISRRVFVSPLGFYDRNDITDHTRAWFLLFYANRSRPRSDVGLFPLFHSARRGTAHYTFVLPFFYHADDAEKKSAFTLLGPLFFGREQRATYGGVAPLVYGRNDGDGGFRFLLFPLLYASHEKLGKTWLVTPLFGFGRSAEGYRWYLGPLYVRREVNQRTVALFPIAYDGVNPSEQKRTSFVLPLFFRSASPERSLTMVTPLFWNYRTLASRTTLLFPLLFDQNEYYRSRTTAVGALIPFVVRHRDDLQDATTWVFPPLLTYYKNSAAERPGFRKTSLITFPVLFHFTAPERQTTVLFPLFYYLKRPATKTVVALPLFGYRSDEHNNRSLLLLPLLTWARNGGDGSRERVVFPLLWHFSSQDRQSTVVFPLFWHFKRPNATVSVLFPLGAHWRTARGHSTIVLNTYVHKGTGEYAGAWSFHFWPLFNVGRPRVDDLEWSVLYGLLGYSREGIHRTFRLLWGIVIPLEPVGTQTRVYGATLGMSSTR